MQVLHPLQNLLLMTFFTPAELVDDLVEVPTVDTTVQNLLASERRRERLQQPPPAVHYLR